MADNPVTYLDDIDFLAVTRYEVIKTILSDKERFSAEITFEPLNPLHEEVPALLEKRNFSLRSTVQLLSPKALWVEWD